MNKSPYSSISVVLPTYNRRPVLEKCLKAYFRQKFPLEQIEVVIADDGSSDGTEQFISEIRINSPVDIRYFKQANKGVTRARNLGIKNAQNQIILLSDDDVIPVPDLISEHVRWHNLHPEKEAAVLGLVTWSPEIEVDDFMHWCENGGPLFHFPQIEHQTQADCRYFYSCNISLKNSILQENLFDESFYFGFDDFELGYRLSQKGLKLFYNKTALGYHFKKLTFEDMQKRSHITGQAAWVLHQKWPQTKKIVRVRNIWVLRLAGLVSTLLYPMAKILKWRKAVYHFKYQNRLSRIFAQAYSEARLENMRRT